MEVVPLAIFCNTFECFHQYYHHLFKSPTVFSQSLFTLNCIWARAALFQLVERDGAEAGEGRDQPTGELFHAIKGYFHVQIHP